MGSEWKPSKFHYDIGMSKRTRRASDFKKDDTKQVTSSSGFDEEGEGEGEDEAQENESRKSLKQFIQGRSLYQHFSEEEEEEKEKEKEENQLQLVKQKDIQQQGFNGRLKFKSLVSRYGKVLSQLIKIKRNPDASFPKKPFPN